MKRILTYVIIMSFLLIPSLVSAANLCADGNLREYRKALNEIDYNYVIKYDNVANKDKNGVPVKYINISVEGLNDNFMALVMDSGDNSQIISNGSAKVFGGVNNIYFYFKGCTNKPIKTEEIFLPYYNKGATKVFDDGSVVSNGLSTKKILITIGLIVATIGLFVLAIFVLKRGKNK